MSHLYFILLLLLAAISRTPLALFLIVIKSLIPALRKRFVFERKNFIEEECRSFRKDCIVADYCFEISSEGELEQVRPVIEKFLSDKKHVELIFSSPSVESKCLKMAQEHKGLLRVFRLPIVTHSFFFQTAQRWMSARKFIFCRYDFFPELLILKFFGKKFILLSAAAKNPSWFKKEVYRLFDVFVAANAREERSFRALYGQDVQKKIFHFDFRIPRISERIQKAPETLNAHVDLSAYLAFLQTLPASNKLIMGSAWISDFGILKNDKLLEAIKTGSLHLLIVPHDLRPQSFNEMKVFLKNLLGEIPLFEMSLNSSQFNPSIPGVVLLNKSGVLCELYTRFASAYVGGGFARSIHSVLEPYLCGARVYCGPKIERSTEYDFIAETSPKEIHLLNDPETFYNLFISNAQHSPDLKARESLLNEAESKMESIIQEIRVC
ncbi:MAG: hypothetical protein KBD76_03270 [Bacteriovorax sp.]|nr:hypothetical protein [Bacteriovorax sp.]